MDVIQLLQVARRAAAAADAEIMSVYQASDFQVQLKADESPLTLADKKSHQAITKILAQTGIPILSEESQAASYEERKNWNYLWLVDPLDGTKEFIKHNGEFTVNIALIEGLQPLLGVVSLPASGVVYYGGLTIGAYKSDKNGTSALKPFRDRVKPPIIRVVASRSHLNVETSAFIESLGPMEIINAGSSLKFMWVAEGKADVYPRFGPTMEWDTAAPHAIVNALGYSVHNPQTGKELQYNKADLLNPNFLCVGVEQALSL